MLMEINSCFDLICDLVRGSYFREIFPLQILRYTFDTFLSVQAGLCLCDNLFVQDYTDMGFISILLFVGIGTVLTMIVQASAASSPGRPRIKSILIF